MLDKHEREERRSLIFSIACTICGMFLLAMILVSHFDLLIVSVSDYQNQTIELSDAEAKIKRLEYELENPEEVIDWGAIGTED